MIDVQALMFAGITPPSDGSIRTTCPKCSATRRKPRERCLSITPMDWGVLVRCYHCKWEDGIV